ncbi:SDR family NAD(P)-dependent oxidoreductase [Commensalibacter papalotli (ex Servin-Garciduenas et al. 2014)]|uniref:Short-chain dehydrogenase/reductase SDR n=1 Tax=Commensalibacter papalotli (ex Servin-Garciduenas et al. 2014) TaxID=1208583 RepID=W7DPD4_9PROT|nr:glucose 1-dehydrogenase [Commensalibacter papalotli (ex Servin-Garciduenas et al. 2014)]EUK19222.1 short-chain dehydrogenase/reductase SDR [Commensalibacter papalotli (ex Servin-Garciduenas et al. 2014)]
MQTYFKNKVALITGGAQGIGFDTAKAFADQGANVIIADYNEKQAQIAAQEINKQGNTAIAITCDVSKEDHVKATITQIIDQFGQLDIAFNNAGVQSPVTNIADLTSEEYDRTLNINLKGVWLCMKYELLQMRKQGSGVIVNCSSLGGLVGGVGRAAYHATKHGVLGLTKSAALEYAIQNIRINAICPGTIDTPMVEKMFETGDLSREDLARVQPIGRLGKGSEIADAVLWLCSPASSFVIGQSISVDGGYIIQ